MVVEKIMQLGYNLGVKEVRKMNQDIKERAKVADIKLWRIADEIGIADTTFSKKLRRELSVEEKTRIFAIIDKLAQESI